MEICILYFFLIEFNFDKNLGNLNFAFIDVVLAQLSFFTVA